MRNSTCILHIQQAMGCKNYQKWYCLNCNLYMSMKVDVILTFVMLSGLIIDYNNKEKFCPHFTFSGRSYCPNLILLIDSVKASKLFLKMFCTEFAFGPIPDCISVNETRKKAILLSYLYQITSLIIRKISLHRNLVLFIKIVHFIGNFQSYSFE